MLDFQGFILVGGESRRMGRDKAQLRLGRRTFVERIAEALSGLTGEITLVGRNDNCAPYGMPIISDVYERWGPLGGIYTSLAHCASSWAVIIACDLPFVTAEFLRALSIHRENYDAVVPVQRDGQWQPLCGLYSRASCLPLARELIAAGERRPRALVRKARTCFVPEESFHATGHLLMNVNTPEEYAAALKQPTI